MHTAAYDSENDAPGKAEEHDALILGLRRTRLELLPVLYALLKTGSVTKAARSLHLTQSAVSQNLRSLRSVFNDDLLVPVGRSLVPTELALGLLEPLTRLLQEAENLVSPRVTFDPLTEEIHVVIATADYVCQLLAPRLVEVCARLAPKATIEFVEGSSTTTLEDLSRVDFFIAPRAYGETFGKRIRSATLWQDRIVCIGAATHDAFPSHLGPEDIARFRQVGYRASPKLPERVRRLIHPTGEMATPRTCVTPGFTVLGAIVEGSDCVALIPRILALDMMQHRRLKIGELDRVETNFEVAAFWSPSTSSKRGHQWLQQLLKQIATDMAKEHG